MTSTSILARPVAKKTPGWHNAIKTHCPVGHPYDEGNTRYDLDGARTCRTCRNAQAAACMRRRRAARRASLQDAQEMTVALTAAEARLKSIQELAVSAA